MRASMDYLVQSGDSLWLIAQRQLGNPNRWPEIAKLNHLSDPNRVLVGQHLLLPADASRLPENTGSGARTKIIEVHRPFQQRPAVIPVRAFFFVLADEVSPFRRKLVRKVVVPKGLENPHTLERILHPERYGFSPLDPASHVTPGRHVLGMTDSRYVSTSEHALGSPRFGGKRYFIDAAKVEASGAVIHEGSAIAADLDRIAAKTKEPRFKAYIEDIRQKSLIADREVLVEGHIPAGAVKGAGAMAVTRGFQVVEGIGIMMTFYDLGKAGAQSYQQNSVVPLATEAVRQTGGWAGAWAGAEIGSATGALFGIETGPGAIVTGIVGGFIGGVGGFLGADWAVNRIGGGE